jgi:predicted homoserine dehydrogenase-like protein
MKPREAGGSLHHAAQVEVISSLERDGRPVFRDLRWGVYVTFAAGHEYVRRCFHEYGIVTDSSGEYAAMYKPSHLIGLELGISVASVALRPRAHGRGDGDGAAIASPLPSGRMRAGRRCSTAKAATRCGGKLMARARTRAAKKALPIGAPRTR